MEIILTAKHCHLEEKTKEHIYRHINKLERKYTKLNSIHFILDKHKEKMGYSAEVILYGKQINIEAKVVAQELYPTIDKAFDKIKIQLYKKVNKWQKHHHTSISELEDTIHDETRKNTI